MLRSCYVRQDVNCRLKRYHRCAITLFPLATRHWHRTKVSDSGSHHDYISRRSNVRDRIMHLRSSLYTNDRDARWRGEICCCDEGYLGTPSHRFYSNGVTLLATRAVRNDSNCVYRLTCTTCCHDQLHSGKIACIVQCTFHCCDDGLC